MIDRIVDSVTTMESFDERLQRALDLSGKTVKDLARVLVSPKPGKHGVSEQAVYQVLRGETNQLTAENVALAGRFLGVDIFWLATGKGSPRPRDVDSGLMPLSELLIQVGIVLAQVPKAARKAVADNMHGWALEGGADHYRAALLGLLAEKRRPSPA